jgi:hypothetical protein
MFSGWAVASHGPRIFARASIELLAGIIPMSVDYTFAEQYKHRMGHTYIHAPSAIWNHDLSVSVAEESTRLWLLGYCDRCRRLRTYMVERSDHCVQSIGTLFEMNCIHSRIFRFATHTVGKSISEPIFLNAYRLTPWCQLLQTDTFQAGHKSFKFSLTQNIHPECPLLVHTVSQLNPARILTPNFFKTSFNNTLSTHRSPG